MLLNSFAYISFSFLDSFSIAEAARQCGAISQVAHIFRLFLNDDFEGVVGHVSGSFASEVYHKHDLSPFATLAPTSSLEQAFNHAVGLLNLASEDDGWGSREKESTRASELLCEAMFGKTTYGSELAPRGSHFFRFAMAARAGRERHLIWYVSMQGQLMI